MAPDSDIPPKATIASPGVRSYGVVAVLGIAVIAVVIALVLILR